MTAHVVEFLFLLYISHVFGAVLFEFMDLCVCYDLVVLKYLSKPNNVL